MSETDKLGRAIHVGALILFTILLVMAIFDTGKDATDPQRGRSGMALATDAGTGCQYLVRGGITPRLDRDGKHICVGN